MPRESAECDDGDSQKNELVVVKLLRCGGGGGMSQRVFVRCQLAAAAHPIDVDAVKGYAAVGFSAPPFPRVGLVSCGITLNSVMCNQRRRQSPRLQGTENPLIFLDFV